MRTKPVKIRLTEQEYRLFQAEANANYETNISMAIRQLAMKCLKGECGERAFPKERVTAPVNIVASGSLIRQRRKAG